MRYMEISNAEPGMILAHAIYDMSGRVLLGVNGILTESYIKRIREYGFTGVYIQDELSQDIVLDDIIEPKLREEGMKAVQKGDIDACKKVAEKIVEDMLGKGQISLDMADLRSYDDYTFAHSVNVAVICSVIGIGLGYDSTRLRELVIAALLHDLGKLAIDTEVLNKPERLSKEEFEQMKRHTEISYDMLSERWDLSSAIKTAVRFHHENEDGSGYPKGLDGSELNQYAKILHVADVYDAMTSKRPYKEPYSSRETIEYLMGACGILFDLKSVEALLKYLPLYPKGTTVTLSNGEKALVVENSGNYNLRPLVRLMNGENIDLTRQENFNITIVEDDVESAISIDEEEARIKMRQKEKQYHILVVDDMKTNLLMIRDMLKDEYRLTLVNSGEKAVDYLLKNPEPDLILLDIDMPGMSGIEMMEHLAAIKQRPIPVLFVTSICDKATVLRCRQLGAKGYIVRPYQPGYVKTEIKRILSGWNELC